MHSAFGLRSKSISRRLCLGFAIVLGLAVCAKALAQNPNPLPRLKGLSPAGGRSFLSNSNGSLAFGLSNPTSKDIDARVLTFYDDLRSKQYGRDVWVPAKATLWSWFLHRPARARRRTEVRWSSNRSCTIERAMRNTC